MKISIVIPTYRSLKFIEKTVSSINEYASRCSQAVELVIVDDGSEDGTYDFIVTIALKYQLPITAVQLFRNRGQFRAAMAGFRYVSGDLIVTMDDDLEYLPTEIDALMKPFQENPGKWDVAIGLPESRKRNLIRDLGSYIINVMNTIMFNKPRHLRSGSFRMMTAEFVSLLTEYETANPVLGPLIFKSTRRIVNVPVKYQKGLRSSNYKLSGLVKTFFHNLQNFSEFPLKVISIAGFAISMIAFLASLLITIQYFTGFPWTIKAPGWTSLIVSLCFFSGLILASIGLIGQYIFRIIEEVNKTPNYQIRVIKSNHRVRQND